MKLATAHTTRVVRDWTYERHAMNDGWELIRWAEVGSDVVTSAIAPAGSFEPDHLGRFTPVPSTFVMRYPSWNAEREIRPRLVRAEGIEAFERGALLRDFFVDLRDLPVVVDEAVVAGLRVLLFGVPVEEVYLGDGVCAAIHRFGGMIPLRHLDDAMRETVRSHPATKNVHDGRDGGIWFSMHLTREQATFFRNLPGHPTRSGKMQRVIEAVVGVDLSAWIAEETSAQHEMFASCLPEGMPADLDSIP